MKHSSVVGRKWQKTFRSWKILDIQNRDMKHFFSSLRFIYFYSMYALPTCTYAKHMPIQCLLRLEEDNRSPRT